MKRKRFVLTILLTAILVFTFASCAPGGNDGSEPFSETPIEGLDLASLCGKLTPDALLGDAQSVNVTSSFEGSDVAVLRMTYAKKDGIFIGNCTKNTSCERIFDGDTVHLSFNSGDFYTLITFGQTYNQAFESAFADTIMFATLKDREDVTVETNLLDDGTGEAAVLFTADEKWASYLSPAAETVKAGSALRAYVELDGSMKVVSVTYSLRTDSGALIKLMEQSFATGDEYAFPETKFDWAAAERVSVTIGLIEDPDEAKQTFSVPVGSRIDCDPFNEAIDGMYFFTKDMPLLPFRWYPDRNKITEDTALYIFSEIR